MATSQHQRYCSGPLGRVAAGRVLGGKAWRRAAHYRQNRRTLLSKSLSVGTKAATKLAAFQKLSGRNDLPERLSLSTTPLDVALSTPARTERREHDARCGAETNRRKPHELAVLQVRNPLNPA